MKPSLSALPDKDSLLRSAELVYRRQITRNLSDATTANDMFLEAVLVLYDAFGKEEYLALVRKIVAQRETMGYIRHNWRLFTSGLSYELYLRTGNEQYLDGFTQATLEMKKSLQHDLDGAIVVPGDGRKCRISVEMLQAYAIWMARAGKIADEPALYDEAVEQYRIFYQILCDNRTGLWHHGRGWSDDPAFISPGFWCPAQGWVLHGLAGVLSCLPPASDHLLRLKEWFSQLAYGLLPLQNSKGLWHQLVDRQDAYPETSGTALIAHHFLRAVRAGWLPEDPFRNAAEKAIRTLQNHVQRDGSVSYASAFTEPLRSVEGYLHLAAIPGYSHSAAPFLLAFAAPFLPGNHEDVK